jgi:hypothetical protein
VKREVPEAQTPPQKYATTVSQPLSVTYNLPTGIFAPVLKIQAATAVARGQHQFSSFIVPFAILIAPFSFALMFL